MERYTMKDFMEKKIAVTFENAGELKRFSQACEKSGLIWLRPSEKEHWNTRCTLACAFDVWTEGKHVGDKANTIALAEVAHRACKWEIIPFSAFDFAKPATEQPEQKITIEEIDAAITGLRKMRDKLSRPGPNGFKTHELHIYADDKRVWATYKHGNAVERFEEKRDIKQMFSGVVASINDTIKYVSDAEKPDEHQPVPAPRKPAVVDLVYMTRDCEGYKKGEIAKISSICGPCHTPKSHNPAGREVHLPADAYLPVREVDRPAKVGEWIVPIEDCAEYYKKGEIRQTRQVYDNCVYLECTSTSNGFSPSISNENYRVLEPYSPEVPHA